MPNKMLKNTRSKTSQPSQQFEQVQLTPHPLLVISLLFFIVIALGLPWSVNANENVTATVNSISTGGLKQINSIITPTANMLAITQQSPVDKKAIQGKTRSENKLLNKQHANNNSLAKSHESYGFSIYQAFSYLLTDIDEDGYFQRFSIVFDADLHSSSPYDIAQVYAELYTRSNGGPWIHYFTTENFIIEGDNENDEYEVVTTFYQGYVTGEYDVLVDLYEVGYSDIVATFSSNDSNALYALPLESEDYDPEYIEYYSESDGHGGSLSIYTLLFLLLMLVRLLPALFKKTFKY